MGRLVGVTAAPFTYAAHVLAAAAAVMVLVWNIHFRGGLAFEATNKNLIFNLHPVFMVIGFIIFGGEAIMSYRGLPFSKDVKKLIHLILHACAVVLGAVGIYAAFKNHNESGIPNLYSLHSWLGLGTIILYAIQWIFGLIAFFYPGAAPAVRRDALPWHVLVGLFLYILAIATSQLGFLEKLTFLESAGVVDKYGTEAFLVNFTAIAVLLFGTAVVVSAIAPTRIEDNHSYSTISES